MKKLRAPLLLLLLVTSFFSCSSEEEVTPTPLEANTLLDVSYGSHPQQIYDLYLPENRNSNTTKVIVLIHGGGWTEGDKIDMTNFVTIVQQNHPKHAIVNINYVLANATTPAFPNQFLDVDSVIEKITNESETLQLLPEFALIGVSAGAHISLMYDAVYDTDDQVKFVANVVGPSDFTDAFYANNPNFQFLLQLLVDESRYPNTTNYSEALSPSYQISSSTSPAVMFYGNEDPLVPLTNGEAIDAAFTNAQISHNYTVYQGGHGDDWSALDKLNLQVQISEYIDTYLSIEP